METNDGDRQAASCQALSHCSLSRPCALRGLGVEKSGTQARMSEVPITGKISVSPDSRIFNEDVVRSRQLLRPGERPGKQRRAVRQRRQKLLRAAFAADRPQALAAAAGKDQCCSVQNRFVPRCARAAGTAAPPRRSFRFYEGFFMLFSLKSRRR